jgi:hypothetical protein
VKDVKDVKTLLGGSIAVACLALTAGLLAAQSVTSATIRVVRKPVSAVIVSVTNRYSKPLTMLAIRVAGFRSRDAAFNLTSGAAPNVPVPPGETRSFAVRFSADEVDQAAVFGRAFIFADGHVEGDAAVARAMADEFQPYPGPPGTRVPNRIAIPTVDTAVTSVVISGKPGTAEEIVAVVENLRDVPIRAWSVERRGAGLLAGASGGLSMWACEPDAPRAGEGLIKPREVREIDLGPAEDEAPGSTPIAMLAGVLFDDQKYEGAPATRDALLKQKPAAGCR